MTHRTTRTWIALTLAASLLLSGCSMNAGTARPAGKPRASAASTPTAAATSTPTTATAETSASASATRSVAATASASTSTSVPIAALGGSASKRILPLNDPIARLPQPKPAGRFKGARDAGVPVLMYHVIGTPPSGAANPDLYVEPDEFVQQMTWLLEHGYHAVTLQQVYDFWHNGGSLPSKPVVISFDDGDGPHFTIVAPLLNEVQWPGTLNLIVGRKKPRLKTGIVRRLIACGWEIDSHTMTHMDVPGLSQKELTYQIGKSRKKLHDMYGVPVNFFCYPSGRYDDKAVAAVKAAGYLGATTTRYGLARPGDPFLMKRVRVSRGTSGKELGALISSAH